MRKYNYIPPGFIELGCLYRPTHTNHKRLCGGKVIELSKLFLMVRVEMGWSQKKMAQYLESSEKYSFLKAKDISLIERGHRWPDALEWRNFKQIYKNSIVFKSNRKNSLIRDDLRKFGDYANIMPIIREIRKFGNK